MQLEQKLLKQLTALNDELTELENAKKDIEAKLNAKLAQKSKITTDLMKIFKGESFGDYEPNLSDYEPEMYNKTLENAKNAFKALNDD